jgi:hypothetical protein
MIRMVEDSSLAIKGCGTYEVNPYAHGQVASKLGIPKAYYDKIESIPGLRTINVNEIIRSQGEKRMVRTLDGNVRAFLSDKYRPIDHYELLAETIFPVLQQFKSDLIVKAHSISDIRFYLELVFPGLQGEVKEGDVIQAGIIATNSEVGAGALDIKQLVWRCVCSNGMIRKSLFRKHHIGSRIEDTGVFKPDTIRAELESYKLRLRDVIDHSLTHAAIQDTVKEFQIAAGDEIDNITKTVENVTKRYQLGERDRDKLIGGVIRDDNINRYGLANSITALAHEIEDPDRQYEVEKIGGQIIELSPSEWHEIAA